MIFSTIEDEAALSGHKITNIFSQTAASIRTALQQTQGISFNTGFNMCLNQDIVALTNFITAVRSGVPFEQAFANTMREASVAAQQYAQNTNLATLNVNNFIAQQKQAEITNLANGNTLNNLKNLNTLYNDYKYSLEDVSNGLTKCGLSQEEFLNAVKANNPEFAKWLKNLDGSERGLIDYAGQLVGATAKTIGLQIATTALNAAISMGISFLVSGAVQLLNEIYGKT